MRLQIGFVCTLMVGLSSCDNSTRQSLASEVESVDRSNQVAARTVTPGGALQLLWTFDVSGQIYTSYFDRYAKNTVLGSFDGINGADVYTGINVYLNTGAGLEYCSSCRLKLDALEFRTVYGDFNGDRLTDILVQPKSPGGYEVYLSTGDRNKGFVKSWTGNWPSWGDKITVGDFDGNGRDDLFIQSIGSGWGGYQVYLSAGGTFQYGWKEGWPSWADKVVTGKFTNDYVSDILVTGDRGAGPAWGGWNLRQVAGNKFIEVARGGWPSWGEQISVGKVIPGGRDQIVVNANIAYTNWNGFKLMDWNGSGFVETYSAAWPSSREKIIIGDISPNWAGINQMLVAPSDYYSALNGRPLKGWHAYSFPITN